MFKLKFKKYEFPFMIIKKEEYKDLIEAKENFIKLCDEKKIEPLSDFEMYIFSSPLFSFSTRLLLRKFKENK